MLAGAYREVKRRYVHLQAICTRAWREMRRSLFVVHKSG